MVEKLIEDMRKALARAVAAGYCQGYESDFEKFDEPRIRAEANKQLNWVWVITPMGTHLSIYGICAKSNEVASAILHSGYGDKIQVFHVQGFTLSGWNRKSADMAVTKHERFTLDGSAVMYDSKRLATFEAKVTGSYEKRRHEFHFRTESNSVGKMELIGMREIAIQEAVRKEKTLFAKVSCVTVNVVDWDVLMDALTANSTPSATTVVQQDLVLA